MWDPVTGDPVGEPLTDHRGDVTSVALGAAADGRLLLATGSGPARVWDPVARAMVGDWIVGDHRLIGSVAFGAGADGRLLLATGDDSGTARVWDPVTGDPWANR